jgi:hypothetical protein
MAAYRVRVGDDWAARSRRTKIRRIAVSGVHVSARLLQLFHSPDGQWLAVPLVEAQPATWALPTSDVPMKPLTDFVTAATSSRAACRAPRIVSCRPRDRDDIALFDGLI